MSSAGSRGRSRRPPARRRSRAGWVALTGTPGTGKSSVSHRLPGPLETREVGELAVQLRAGHRSRRGPVEVDLAQLRRRFRTYLRSHPAGIVVGHLAHFLPVQYIIVLRCHPRTLARRLRKTRRGAKERHLNVLSETLDIVLVEALATGLPVREVDTTGRTLSAVAREVARLIRERPGARYGRVNWMADPHVTEELLRGRF